MPFWRDFWTRVRFPSAPPKSKRTYRKVGPFSFFKNKRRESKRREKAAGFRKKTINNCFRRRGRVGATAPWRFPSAPPKKKTYLFMRWVSFFIVKKNGNRKGGRKPPVCSTACKRYIIASFLALRYNQFDKYKFKQDDDMKKFLQVICCAVGGGMIGFFANQLNTAVGCVFFALGVALLVGSIIVVSKQDKGNK